MLRLVISRLIASDNITGLTATQDGAGWGSVRLSGSDLTGTTTPLDFTGIDRFVDANNSY